MTEAQWLACRDPELMLQFLRAPSTGVTRLNTPSHRKFRLFGCACCRRIERFVGDSRPREAIAVAERFAEGPATTQELRAASAAAAAAVEASATALQRAALVAGVSRAVAVVRPLGNTGAARLAALAAFHLGSASPTWRAAFDSARTAAEAVAWSAVATETGTAAWEELEEVPATTAWYAARRTARTVEETAQADLLRHIVGNPFRQVDPVDVPSHTVDLARAVYAGQDCAFALHDALLERGHPELATHFRSEVHHPKGCWVLDLLLGKE